VEEPDRDRRHCGGLTGRRPVRDRTAASTVATVEFEAIRTDRLVLRPWRPEDKGPFAAMNADPTVMEFFAATLSRSESDALADTFAAEMAKYGFCPWAVEVGDGATFAGFIGLHNVPAYLSFAPAVEIGWRLARPWWGRGLATEGAGAALRFGFEALELDEIVSFTAVVNERSQRVMQRLGMTRASREDFDHPHVPEGHLVRPHVLYRLTATDWRARWRHGVGQ
jgi:RimJ/RimL family protein N-acetyltransferase